MLLPLAFAIAVLPAACDGDATAPDRLLDGSRASPPAVVLEDGDRQAVLTRVRILTQDQLGRGSPAVACVRERRGGRRLAGPLVLRVGVIGESVTFRDRSARGLYGCDTTGVPSGENRRWCGGAFGTLHRGRLRDPRLDLVCTANDGTRVGFVWVQPARDARYVGVQQRGYVEVYEVAGRLPVRVATTSDVDVERSSARFELSEHDRRGRLLRRYELEATVAG